MIAMSLGLGGCTLGPDFHTPAADAPSGWASLQSDGRISAPSAEPLDIRWWQSFADAELTALIQRAVANNLDLRMAASRVLQARALRSTQVSGQYPTIDANGNYSRARNSAEGLSDASGEDGKAAFNYWDTGLSAAWELDLWGRVRRQVEAADASFLVAENQRRGVLLSLLADVAHDYIALRQVQATLAVNRDNLGLSRHSLRLSRQRLEEGVATQLDVAQGAAQVASIEARLPPLEQRQGDLIDSLGLLLAEPPNALADELSRSAQVPVGHAHLALGLTSELARRRPDILQAEASLRAATASIGMAQADFYPSIRLTGDLGVQAVQLSSLGNWDARRFAFGPVLSLPLFEGGRLRGVLALREAQQQEAALQYRKVVLQSWHDIAQAMRGYSASQLRRDHLDDAVQQSRTALQAAQRQYVEGAVDFLDVLTVQSTLLVNQEQWIASNAATSQALVSLYSAVGGGWQAFDNQGPPMLHHYQR
jgi:NodT family efflux transporter outer membrane factor (OMF) lipoprotein